MCGPEIEKKWGMVESWPKGAPSLFSTCVLRTLVSPALVYITILIPDCSLGYASHVKGAISYGSSSNSEGTCSLL